MNHTFGIAQALQQDRGLREDARSSDSARRSDSAARDAAQLQQLSQARREEEDRRRVHSEVDDVLRAVGGPANRALPSILTPLGSGKPPSRLLSRGDVIDASVERSSSDPVSLAVSRTGGPVVRDVFAIQRHSSGGGTVAGDGSSSRHLPRVTASPSVGQDTDDDWSSRCRRSSSPVRDDDGLGRDKFDHLSARDKVLARRQDERMRQEEQQKRDLAKAAQVAYADRAFAALKEAEQYRSGLGGPTTASASPRSRIVTSEPTQEDRSVAARLMLPGARYDDGLAGGIRSRDRSPARSSAPSGLVLPSIEASYVEPGRSVEDALDVDSDDSDVPVGDDRHRESGRPELAPPEDDDEIDDMERELRDELGTGHGLPDICIL